MSNPAITKEAYEAVFVHNTAGAAILDQLKNKYWTGKVYKEGDASHSIYQLGQREVIRFILGQLGQLKHGD